MSSAVDVSLMPALTSLFLELLLSAAGAVRELLSSLNFLMWMYVASDPEVLAEKLGYF